METYEYLKREAWNVVMGTSVSILVPHNDSFILTFEGRLVHVHRIGPKVVISSTGSMQFATLSGGDDSGTMRSLLERAVEELVGLS